MDIFKNKTFEVPVIDFNDPKVKKRITDCMKAQQEAIDRKRIDYKQLEQRCTI